jgi:hypothetical protein
LFVLVRWQKMALLQAWVADRLVQLANVPFVRLPQIELKNCAVGKIKNTEGSAMSVGLLAVR